MLRPSSTPLRRIFVTQRSSPSSTPTSLRPWLSLHSESSAPPRNRRTLSTAPSVEDFAPPPLEQRGDMGGLIALPARPPAWKIGWRMATILLELGTMKLRHIRGVSVEVRGEKMRQGLVRLGPAFVKSGQALATRPDVFPPVVCAELGKLQDRMAPYPTVTARALLEAELGAPIDELFEELSDEPLAAASLGQVYKGRLKGTGEVVAVKVQRPGLEPLVILDAYVLRMLAGWIQQVFNTRSDLVGVSDQLVGRILEEIDYRYEASYAEQFAQLFASAHVAVPRIIKTHSAKRVLTMEWVEGVSLGDQKRLEELGIDPEPLIDRGVRCSLDQMLYQGFFHGDPHPGNIMVTKEGKLAYLDFGMMGTLTVDTRHGMVRLLVNFVNRDADELASDLVTLGFIPSDVPLGPVRASLLESFKSAGNDDGTGSSSSSGGSSSTRRLDFRGVVSDLSAVLADHGLRIPATFALVIRSLAALEGTVMKTDPEFKVVARAYPHVVAQMFRDRSDSMRSILKSMVLSKEGDIRWNVLDRLVRPNMADAFTTTRENHNNGNGNGNGNGKSNDDNDEETAVIPPEDLLAAADDAVTFLLSNRGTSVRSGLVRDAVAMAREVADDSVAATFHTPTNQKMNGGGGKGFDADPSKSPPDGGAETREGGEEAAAAAASRQRLSLRREKAASAVDLLTAVTKSAPMPWLKLAATTALHPQTPPFAADMAFSVAGSEGWRLSQVALLAASRVLHKRHTRSS